MLLCFPGQRGRTDSGREEGEKNVAGEPVVSQGSFS